MIGGIAMRLSFIQTAHVLLTLAFLSGICGLAYEVLYARLLSSYLGNIFYVTAAILISFLLSYGIGALVAHRFVRFLPHIEIAIGLYGVLFATFIQTTGFSFTAFVAGLPIVNTFVLTAVCFLLLIIPALLIGFSVPLFTLYISHYKKDGHDFEYVYLLYNAGAALAVLLIEFMLLRTFGIHATILGIAALNGIIGILLLTVPPPSAKPVSDLPENIPRNVWGALFLTGLASGIFQVFIIRISYFIFGPFNENFSIILASGLLGIALGTMIAATRKFSFFTIVLAGACVTFLPVIILDPFITLYSHAFSLAESDSKTLVKIIFLGILTLPVFAIYGATVAHVVRGNEQERVARFAIAITSAGNAVGYLFFIFFLYEFVPEEFMAIVIAGIFLVAALILRRGSWQTGTAASGVLVLAIVAVTAWPPYLLHAGHSSIQIPRALEEVKAEAAPGTTYKKYGSHAALYHNPDGSQRMILDGYRSIYFETDGLSVLAETITGVSPGFFSKNHERALVFGLGTGVTAGGASQVYEHVTVAEISPAVMELTGSFQMENFDVLNNENVTVVLEDGIQTLLKNDEKFDVIINTIPSPMYFSANKLWTKDFFDEIASRLSDGGVFVGWLNPTTGEDALAIMHNTMRESFDSCVYTFISRAYLQFICGNEQLVFTPHDDDRWPAALRERFERQSTGPIADFLYRMLFSPTALDGLIGTDHINTLDLPTLEFMQGVEIERVLGLMEAFIEHAVALEPLTAAPLSLEEVKARCETLQHWRTGSRALSRMCAEI